MLIVIAVAAGAALSVVVYNRVRERDPELASASMRRVHQLAAVVVVICTACEKLFDALQVGGKPKPLYASYDYPSGRASARPSWMDEDDFEDQR
jgi:hypothetical protein